MSRILFLSTDALGDLILREPVFRLARERGVEIALVVRETFIEAARMVAPDALLIPCGINPNSAGESDLATEVAKVHHLIREWSPDEAVCLLKTSNRFDAALFALLESVPRRRFEVIPSQRLSCLTPLIEHNRPALPPAERLVRVREEDSESVAYAELIDAMGWSHGATDFTPRIANDWSGDSPALVGLGLVKDGYVISSPIGIGNLSIKSWPNESLYRTVGYLREQHGLKTLFVGVPEEADELNALAATCGASVWIGGAGKLGELCHLILCAKAYIGADKGPMHLAAALERPVFGLFGGGAGDRFFPVARRSVVVTQRLACFSCGWNCLISNPLCITGIPWTRIKEGVDQLIESSEPGRWVFDGGPVSQGSFVLADRLGAKLLESESDRAARLVAIQTLDALLKESEADRAARLEVIGRLSAQSEVCAAEVVRLQDQLAEHRRDYKDSLQNPR